MESDVTAWESIGIGADNIGSIDLSVVNSSVIAEGHGYGIRLLSVGSATKKSIVDIKESYIQGWGAIFVTNQRGSFGCRNSLITVNDSILWGEGQSHDKHYGFSAIAITDSEDIEVNVNGGTVYANESTEPYVNFFDIQSSSNCSIDFDDTEFIYSTGNDITGNFSLGSFAKAPNNSVSVSWDKFDTTAVQEPYTISLFNSVGLVEYYVIPNGYLLVVPDVPDGADHILPELCESGAGIIEYLKKGIASGYQIYGIGRFDFAGLEFPADNLPDIYLLGAENNEEASLIIDNLKIEETLREKITTNGKVEINYI